MSETIFRRRDTSRRGGFTLLEVAIALAIFVFGALAIIRIFPPALGVIQNSGDQLTAMGFNRSALARFARQPGLVPDAIYDPTPGTGWRDNIVGSVAGTPRRNNSLPVGSIQNIDTAYGESALGHFKNIVGERHTVPTNRIILTQFPYQTGSINLYQEDFLSGVMLSDAGILSFASAVQDSNNTPYTTFSANDKIYVTYRWVRGGRVWTTEQESVTPAMSVSVVQAARPVSQFVAGEVTVRLRRFLSNASSASPNPELGRLDLTTLPTAPAGTKISVDYTVPDWRWMVHDGVPSLTAEDPTKKYVNLPVRPLDDTVTPLFLYSSPPRDAVEPKLGQVIFPASAAGLTARITYRSLDNWAQQLSVAANSYLLNHAVPSTEPWRDCALVGNILYFKPSEAGKSVLVSYSYGSGAAAADTQINERIFTISDDIISDPGGLPSNFAVGGRVSRLELTDLNGNLLGAPVTAIHKIQGVSIQSRTAWLDGDRFSQVSTIGYRGTSTQ